MKLNHVNSVMENISGSGPVVVLEVHKESPQ